MTNNNSYDSGLRDKAAEAMKQINAIFSFVHNNNNINAGELRYLIDKHWELVEDILLAVDPDYYA